MTVESPNLSLTHIALDYAADGFSIIPVRLTFGPDGRIEKKPIISWAAYQAQIPDATTIANWFENTLVNAMGLVLGEATWRSWKHLWVLDVEAEHLAEATAHLDRKLPGWRERTWWSKTVSGGIHVFFLAWNEPATRPFAWGDIKGKNSFVVLPPSSLPDGRGYRWGRFEGEPAAVNPEDLDLPGIRERRLYQTLAERNLREGERNLTLTSLAGLARRAGLDVAAIDALLQAVNAQRCEPPLPEDEVSRIARSVGRYEPGPEYSPVTNRSSATINTPSGGRCDSEPGRAVLVPASELEAEADIDWLEFLGQDGYVGRGLVTLLSARPKTGKTTLLSHAARPWLEAGLTVVWCTEEPRSLWVRRIQELGLPVERFYFVFPGPDDVLGAIEQARPDVVVVDTLRVFIRIPDENDAAKVQAALNPWVNLARGGNFALILLHHRNKTAGPEEGLDHAGSHAFVGAVDIAVSMRFDGNAGSSRRVLEALSRFAETPRQLVVTLAETGYLILGTPAELERERLKERIIEVLDEAGKWLTQAELKRALNNPAQRTFERALAELIQAGRIDHQWPTRGRPAAYRLRPEPEPVDDLGFASSANPPIYGGGRCDGPAIEPDNRIIRQPGFNNGGRSEGVDLEALEDTILALLRLPQAEAEAEAEKLRRLAEPLKDQLDPALLAILEGHRPPEPDADVEREIARIAWQMSIYRPVPEHFWPIIEEQGFSKTKLPPKEQFHKLMKQAEELSKRNAQVRVLARSLLNWLLRPKVDGYLEKATGKPLSIRMCEDCGCEFVTDSGSRMCYLCRFERRKGR